MNDEACIVQLEKILSYLLNSNHQDGESKAKFFIEIAGFSRNEPERYAAALRQHFHDNPKTKTNLSEFGQKLEVIGPMACPNGRFQVLPAWICIPQPRLITAYPYSL